jgi:hypothetical protein
VAKIVKKRKFYNEEKAVKVTNKNDMVAINFAALATATPIFDDHPWGYICIREGKVTGTDRYRIHRAKLETKIEDGLYELIKSTKKECVIERIKDDEGYPSQKAIDKCMNVGGHRLGIVNGLFTILPAILVYLVGKNGQAMRPEYIIDACKLMSSGHVIVTLPTDPNCGVHIEHTDGTMEAFIMPVTVDNEKIKILEGGE